MRWLKNLRSPRAAAAAAHFQMQIRSPFSTSRIASSPFSSPSEGDMTTITFDGGSNYLHDLSHLPQWSKHRFANSASFKESLMKNRDNRVAAFGEEKNLFQTVTENFARQQYMLSLEDLRPLPHFIKQNAYGEGIMHLYIKSMVQDRALQKWGSAEAIKNRQNERNGVKQRRLNRLQSRFSFNMRRATAVPGEHGPTGMKAVYTALAGNVAVTISKFFGYFLTGSGSMLSEAVHSCADCTNQCLLAYGLIKSQKKADTKHPYGYAPQQYVWSLVSGVGVFFMGCGLSVYHGFASLWHPVELVDENVPIALGILGVNFALECYSMGVALTEIKREASKVNMTVKEYITKASDPLNIGVFLEDAAALTGIVLAAGGMGLASYFHSPVFDAIGTIGVGTMLGGLAAFLVKRNTDILTFKSAPPDRTQMVIDHLMRDSVVLSVHDVKTILIGPDLARFKAEIHFSPMQIVNKYLSAHDNLAEITKAIQQAKTDEEVQELLVRYSSHFYSTLAAEIGRLEGEIRKNYPEFKFLGLEII